MVHFRRKTRDKARIGRADGPSAQVEWPAHPAGRTDGTAVEAELHRPLLRFRTWEIAGDSMSPTLEAGDWVVSLDSRFLKPAAGRIAVLRRPGSESEILIKRLLTQEPPGGWYVIGDQPARSTDSRRFGPVPERLIEGIVLFRYGPPRRFGRI